MRLTKDKSDIQKTIKKKKNINYMHSEQRRAQGRASGPLLALESRFLFLLTLSSMGNSNDAFSMGVVHHRIVDIAIERSNKRFF